MTGSGTFTQSAGRTVVNGSMSQSRVTINGGILMGTGTITTINGVRIDPAGGTIQGGTSTQPGTLTINGAFNLGTHGIMQSLIFGPSSYSNITVNGAVNLNGVLDIALGSSFGLGSFSAGQTFDLLNFSSLAGSFSNVYLGNLNNNGLFSNTGSFTFTTNGETRYFLGGTNNLYLDLAYNNSAQNIELSVLSGTAGNTGGSGTTNAVPEPNGLGIMALGLGMLGWFGWRNRKRRMGESTSLGA